MDKSRKLKAIKKLSGMFKVTKAMRIKKVNGYKFVLKGLNG